MVVGLVANLLSDILLVVCFLALLHRFGLTRKEIKLGAPPALKVSIQTSLAIIPVSLGLSLIFKFLSDLLNSEVHSPYSDQLEAAEDLSSIVLLILLFVLLAPVSEELIFRGGLLSLLLKRGAPAETAVVAQAIIFVAVHYSVYLAGASLLFVLDHMLTTFVVGVAAGYLFLQTRSVWSCILLHMMLNGLSTIGAFLPPFLLSFYDLIFFLFLVLGVVILIQKRGIVLQYGRASYSALFGFQEEQKWVLVKILILVALIPAILESLLSGLLDPLLPLVILLILIGYSEQLNLLLIPLILLALIGYWVVLLFASISTRPLEEKIPPSK